MLLATKIPNKALIVQWLEHFCTYGRAGISAGECLAADSVRLTGFRRPPPRLNSNVSPNMIFRLFFPLLPAFDSRMLVECVLFSVGSQGKAGEFILYLVSQRDAA